MNNISIKDALENISQNRYVIPAFQRKFVWSLDQIEKLWDSILLNYPISTFLFWKVNQHNTSETTRFRTFLQECYFNNSKKSKEDDYTQTKIDFDTTDTAILDGQQRLTALYLSLYGHLYICQKHARNNNNATECQLVIELDNTQLNTEEYDQEHRSYNAKKYDIKVVRPALRTPTQFEIKSIMNQKFQSNATRQDAIEDIISGVPANSKDYARHILNELYNKICVEKLITYTELSDNITLPDAVEVFVRFNSAGENLKKYEITTAILETYWPGSKEYFDKLLIGSYRGFGENFIIRTALMLFSNNVVNSSIDQNLADKLKNNWGMFTAALQNLKIILSEFNVNVERFASSWNVLLPAIYAIYYNSENVKNPELKRNIFVYIVRAVLFKFFNSGTTGKLNSLKNILDNNEHKFDLTWLDSKREFAVRDTNIDDIVNSEKSDKIAAETLFYLSRDWIDASSNYYDLDHLHPQVAFDSPIYGISNETWHNWRVLRDRLPNLWLLYGSANRSKNDASLFDYFNNKTHDQQVEFLNQAIIPEDVSFELSDFGDFYEKRKELLHQKLKALLTGRF